MRPVILLSRCCARRAYSRIPTPSAANFQLSRSYTAFRTAFRKQSTGRSSTWKNSRLTRSVLKAAAGGGALGTATFVKLSEKENRGTEQTAEGRMLKVSRDEIEKKIDENDRGLSRVRHKILLYLDLYVWEPLWTGIRFLHLVVIFVPVILAVPAIWFGKRQPNQDNERSGTLWWYGFLVKGMEWAGPAFIKVRTAFPERVRFLD